MVWVKFLRDYEKHKSGETIDIGRFNHACALVRGGIAVWADALSGGSTIITTVDGDDLVQVIDESSGEEAYITVDNFSSSSGGSHTGTTGSVFFAGAGGAGSAPTEDNDNLFWDDTNDYLGLGINSSLTARLHVAGDVSTDDLLHVRRSGSGSTADYVSFGDGGSDHDLVITGDGRVGINIDTVTINAQLRVAAETGGPSLAAALIVDNNDTGSTVGMQVFHDGTTVDGFDLVCNSLTTGTALDIDCDGLTTGSIARLISGSTSAANRTLLHVHNDEAAATGATCLYVLQDSTGPLAEFRRDLTTNGVVFGVDPGGYLVLLPLPTTDAAPSDDTTVKKLSLQRLGSDPTNAAFIKFSNSPGTPTNDFYLVLEEET